MMAMVKAAPNSDTPVVQGLVGALENVVGLIGAIAFGPLSWDMVTGHSPTSYEQSISLLTSSLVSSSC